MKLGTLNKFITEYIHRFQLPEGSIGIFSAQLRAVLLLCLVSLHLKSGTMINNQIHDFLNWVLTTYYSAEDDEGFTVIPHEFRNPVPKLSHTGLTLTESVRTPLPYRYIRELREILCPPGTRYFSDWAWSIKNALDGHSGGDWISVNPAIIDKNDPDCVWRVRKLPVYKIYKGGKSQGKVGERDVYELWSPVRWVLLYIKLELPLRTFQVRVLDSGEADTWRYEDGKWRLNDRFMKQGSRKRPQQLGVFRRIVSPDNGQQMTGLYVNTNKTADINKNTWERGYVVPWQHEKVLYWLERLRNWQEKYNPIKTLTPWLTLEVKHLGCIKHPEILKQYGERLFFVSRCLG